MQMRPAKAREKMITPMVRALSTLVLTGRYDPKTLQELASPVRFSLIVTIIFKLVAKTGITNFFWDQQLKENKVYDQRFQRPYEL